MKHLVLATLLLLSVFFVGGMSGCVLLTQFEQFDLRYVEADVTEEAIETDTMLHICFFKTKNESWIIPGFYSSQVYGEPLRHNLVVWGHFNEIESLSATIQFDDQEPIPLTVDLAQMNPSRKQAFDGRNIFMMDDYFNIDVPWDEFETVTIRAEVEVMIDGKLRVIELLKSFEKYYHRRTGNKIFSALMSV